MCLGIPGQVVEKVDGYGDQLALVDVMGTVRQINMGMLDEAVPPGDWVMIHMGFALEEVDAATAAEAMAGLRLMGQGDTSTDEAAATVGLVEEH
ncbi:MAG: HypC/HybG/HupF family hydrogenase formation chaperone [Nocardioidaceae bacterium]